MGVGEGWRGSRRRGGGEGRDKAGTSEGSERHKNRERKRGEKGRRAARYKKRKRRERRQERGEAGRETERGRERERDGGPERKKDKREEKEKGHRGPQTHTERHRETQEDTWRRRETERHRRTERERVNESVRERERKNLLRGLVCHGKVTQACKGLLQRVSVVAKDDVKKAYGDAALLEKTLSTLLDLLAEQPGLKQCLTEAQALSHKLVVLEHSSALKVALQNWNENPDSVEKCEVATDLMSRCQEVAGDDIRALVEALVGRVVTASLTSASMATSTSIIEGAKKICSIIGVAASPELQYASVLTQLKNCLSSFMAGDESKELVAEAKRKLVELKALPLPQGSHKAELEACSKKSVEEVEELLANEGEKRVEEGFTTMQECHGALDVESWCKDSLLLSCCNRLGRSGSLTPCHSAYSSLIELLLAV